MVVDVALFKAWLVKKAWFDVASFSFSSDVRVFKLFFIFCSWHWLNSSISLVLFTNSGHGGSKGLRKDLCENLRGDELLSYTEGDSELLLDLFALREDGIF